ncbi:orotidine 5-phosphate decarboxylase [Sulfitobacter sp. JBTF-M27]|uniref:Orotidine 5-phosphate decarboxylase n=1 Tax=Sulfitobacter sediminilitoris TaxID=2698830 RepID=A0A6P0CCE6_9RHOB|nr:orotidine 5-phosphate decarboxylase [Sulfitobacter sediminilitoris]NEK22795.1 orotidine 5-phosphate decarboxylase [Sulfitobacter sediminilitoris]
MYTCPIQLSDVRYNASSSSFEALVTVHDNSTVRRYACAINAPISMTFEDAAKGLARQAIRRHQHRGGLFSNAACHAPKQRAGRPGFDPLRWLESIVTRPGRKAA